jgi:periplasmic protein TonB
MFESSLFASQPQHVSSTQRWTTFASIALQATIAAAIITVPLLHPERLIPHTQPPSVVPVFKMPKPPVIKIEQASAAPSSTAIPQLTTAFTAPAQIPTIINMNADTNPAPVNIATTMATGNYNPLVSIGTSSATHVAVVPARPSVQRVNLSTGVTEGMLLTPIRPIYPPIAKAAHVEGTVVVEAIISRGGSIESLHVVSGSPMLQQAAIEAIQVARYRPYMLNGQPTEVQTRITVNFRFGS